MESSGIDTDNDGSSVWTSTNLDTHITMTEKCPGCGAEGKMEGQLADNQYRCPTDNQLCGVVTFKGNTPSPNQVFSGVELDVENKTVDWVHFGDVEVDMADMAIIAMELDILSETLQNMYLDKTSNISAVRRDVMERR